MNATKITLPVTLALSALSIAALTTGCSSSHPRYYTTTLPGERSSYAQSSQPYSGSSGSTTESQTSPAQSVAASDSGNTVVPLFEESVRVGTREVDAGAVRLRKVVTTETVNQPVQVRRERLVVDREQGGAQQGQASSNFQQGSQQASSFSGQPFQEQEVVIRLKREEPVVETQLVPAGRVVAQKRTETEQQNIQRQVRHEDVQVEKIGNPENVTISENLRQSSRRSEASGAGPALEGQTQGSARNAPITDIQTLASAQQQDATTFNGRPVNISNAKVQQILGEHLVALQSSSNQRVFARVSTPVRNIHEGDTVMLRGIARQVPSEMTSLQLNEQESQALRGQPLYIDARSLQPASSSSQSSTSNQ